jgi:hypothetical protein
MASTVVHVRRRNTLAIMLPCHPAISNTAYIHSLKATAG